jgi:hypothetical protein
MKNKILYIISVLVILVYSCELPDNVDPKNPVSVQAESVFTSALVALDSLIGSINQNVNISRLLVQYQSQVQYIDESRYNFQDRQIPDLYSAILYRDVLMNLHPPGRPELVQRMIVILRVAVKSPAVRR